MKSFKQLLFEVKSIDYSNLSSKDIDKHHDELSPEEKTKFSNIIDPESRVPVLVQQRKALQQIHNARNAV